MVAGGKPDWLRVKAPVGEGFARVREIATRNGLNTVCASSHCPNISECWSRGHATFMVLGEVCTRSCRFCAVRSGTPSPVDDDEPHRVASATRDLELQHAVVTSVTRDDLPDHGAGHLARVVRSIRDMCHTCRIELLVPDMRASPPALGAVVASRPDVMGHNIETVERLQGVRDHRASYELSLQTLRTIKDLEPSILTKSSLMLGLGERTEEVLTTLRDLRSVGVDMVTMGQYLRPRGGPLAVTEYVEPKVFRELDEAARELGFRSVSSAPLVRSSFNAAGTLVEVEAHADR